jgi:2-polyprenyl-3-methyl-5-hydroxy-6-metoxy-1,4-benzoquinol methylase
MRKNSKTSFEKEYFTGHYRAHVGNFSTVDLVRSKNWFLGWLKFLQRYAPIKHGGGEKVLEIGCSIGGVSNLLAERGFTVYASDISEYSVTRARKLAKKVGNNIEFFIVDVEKKIPLKEAFDFIFCFEVLEHLRNPKKALINMYSKTKKGGYVICSSPNALYDVSTDPTHINVKTPDEWKRIFYEVGFRKVLVKEISFLPLFYKWHRLFSFALPIIIRSKYVVTPAFFIAKK